MEVPSQTETLFKVEDLNQVIKIYAYEIQERIDELSRLSFSPSDECNNENNYQIQTLLEKYRGYQTTSPTQIKYI